MEYNFRNVVMRWQIEKSAKVIRCIFTPAPTVSVRVTFKIVELEK